MDRIVPFVAPQAIVLPIPLIAVVAAADMQAQIVADAPYDVPPWAMTPQMGLELAKQRALDAYLKPD